MASIEGGLEAPAAHVALVTGASRGVGRGIALGLLAVGFRVYGSGRSIDQADLPPGHGGCAATMSSRNLRRSGNSRRIAGPA